MLLAAALAISAQSVQLYLANGDRLTVREYEVKGDRVRYYSLDRSQWEEIPLALVDLKKTEQTIADKVEQREALRQQSAVERAAERKGRTELHKVPIEDGVYYFHDDQATALDQREILSDKSKKRGLLQIVLPLPIIAGKNDLYITGADSPVVAREAKPIFVLRIEDLHQFGILRIVADEKKQRRVVQTLNVVPQTKEVFEEQDEVEVFRQEMARNVYRVWPVQPLESGEYAIFDYTPGEVDLRAWDFSVRLEAGPSEPPSAEQ
jgi:hypothetical protein